MFYLFHCLLETWTSITLYPLRVSTPNRGEHRPRLTAPQQLGIREGLCDPLPLSWLYAIGGCVSLLLRSEDSRQEVVGQLQRRCWEGASNALPAIVQGVLEALLQGVMQSEGPHSFRWVPSLLGGEAKPPEAQVSRGPSPSGAGSM